MKEAESFRERLARGLYYKLFTPQYSTKVNADMTCEEPTPCEWEDQCAASRGSVYMVTDNVLKSIKAAGLTLCENLQ